MGYLDLGGNTRFKVPQNIDMQDRILGPLTMVQFLYSVVGLGSCYGIYMSAIPKPFSFILIVPVALLTGAMVFLKINERPFLDFVISVLEFSAIPRQRIWHHANVPDLKVEIVEHVERAPVQTTKAKSYSREEIEAVAHALDDPNLQVKK